MRTRLRTRLNRFLAFTVAAVLERTPARWDLRKKHVYVHNGRVHVSDELPCPVISEAELQRRLDELYAEAAREHETTL